MLNETMKTSAVELADTLEELAVIFGETAMEISRVAGMFRGESIVCEEDEMDFDSNVLYAVPGKPFEVVDEDYAIEAILLNHHTNVFRMHSISDDMFAVYPEDAAVYSVRGHVIVEGPLYVCHIYGQESEIAKQKYMEAALYLTLHATYRSENGKTADKVNGFLLMKEE